MDFIESGKLATDAVKFFVLDEADRLLDQGSQELVMRLFSKLPKAATGTQRLQVHAPTVWDHTAVQGCYAVDACCSESCQDPSHQHLYTSYKSNPFSSEKVMIMVDNILFCQLQMLHNL